MDKKLLNAWNLGLNLYEKKESVYQMDWRMAEKKQLENSSSELKFVFFQTEQKRINPINVLAWIYAIFILRCLFLLDFFVIHFSSFLLVDSVCFVNVQCDSKVSSCQCKIIESRIELNSSKNDDEQRVCLHHLLHTYVAIMILMVMWIVRPWAKTNDIILNMRTNKR